jgi:hypothetical protein
VHFLGKAAVFLDLQHGNIPSVFVGGQEFLDCRFVGGGISSSPIVLINQELPDMPVEIDVLSGGAVAGVRGNISTARFVQLDFNRKSSPVFRALDEPC